MRLSSAELGGRVMLAYGADTYAYFNNLMIPLLSFLGERSCRQRSGEERLGKVEARASVPLRPECRFR